MSNSQLTSLVCNNFGGIRRKSSSFSDECITCSDCQNVELYYTNLNSGVGVRTAKGNIAMHTFSHTEEVGGEDVTVVEKIVGMFSSNQGGTNNVIFVYTEDNTQGYLYKCDIYNSTYEKLTFTGGFTLPVSNMACGADFEQGYYNYFVFSNGKKFVYCRTNLNNNNEFEVITTQPEDVDNNEFSGLGLKVFDSRLWVFDGHKLYYSFTGKCDDFKTQSVDQQSSSAGIIELPKPITAIEPYLGSLAVFHRDSSCLVTPDNTTVYSRGDESPGGCAGYDALVFHGTDLYFYDDTKKGVFAFSQIVNGDKVLSKNIAEDIQEELLGIGALDTNNIHAVSVVTEDRNEVWFITPINAGASKSLTFIFDYTRGEWIKRLSNQISCILVYNSDLYSGGSKLYKEYQTYTFDGETIESFYKCSIFNYGTDNTLKITKFPPRLTVDIGDGCDFWIEYVRNYDIFKTPKRKRVKGKVKGNYLKYDKGMHYDSGLVYLSTINSITKLPSVTFKALEMNFKAETEGQGFSIKNIEFSKLKVKQV